MKLKKSHTLKNLAIVLLLGSAKCNYIETNFSNEIVPSGKYPGFGAAPGCGYSHDDLGGTYTKAACDTWCGSTKWCLHWLDSGWCGKFDDENCSTWDDDSSGSTLEVYEWVTCTTSLADASFSNPASIPFNAGGSVVSITTDYKDIFTHS